MNLPAAPTLVAADFNAFFREIYGYDPFPWQIELARRACSGDWPRFLSVPTGSGKTAALDAAVFALAAQAHLPAGERTVGRRIFYVVNRRVIVDEAHERARTIAAALREPRDDQPTVAHVASALRSINAGSSSPLESVQLRGGIYRDQSWARSLTQPLIVASTVDQVGSRLLFRGYGVSASMRPVHAALVAHDSLILLDEAHISRPFAQTLNAIKAFRDHGSAQPGKPDAASHHTVRTPFAFLQMTATPPTDTTETDILRLSEADSRNPVLATRLNASKPAKLVIADKASGAKALDVLAAKLAEETLSLSKQDPAPRSIAILVNRVAVARKVEDLLTKHFAPGQITLLIGRMRPFDRDGITGVLRARLKTRHPDAAAPATGESRLRIVVATQCLEVGADFDFDALVTECASFDALRQRFGRLNRGGRPIAARATIVIRADQIFPESADLDTNAKAQDPIYGTALGRTWNWLSAHAHDGVIDFGLKAMDAHVSALRQTGPADEAFGRLLSPAPAAPVLLPAYLDAWTQTSPEPTPQPEPALFIHGPGRSAVDVQICWRSDLPDTAPNIRLADWLDTISLCPPSSVECLSIPLHEFSNWFFGGSNPDGGDILGTAQPEAPDIAHAPENKIAIIWRGLRDSRKLEQPTDLRPGDTVVLRPADGGWGRNELGHLPGATAESVDQAERAFRQIKQRQVIRLRSEFFPTPAKDSALARLLEWAADANRDWSKAELRATLTTASAELPENHPAVPAFKALAERKNGLGWTPYPDEKGVVLVTHHRVPELKADSAPNIAEDDGEDMLSKTTIAAPLPLAAHLNDVLAATRQTLAQLSLSPWQAALTSAAMIHDWGKADERFQAMLLNGTRSLAWAQPILLAKSEKLPETAAAYETALRRAELPKGFRHELLSVQLAETPAATPHLPADALQRALALHLIASHHGHARPFAPWVPDDSPPSVEVTHNTTRIHLSGEERLACPPHRLDSGVAERFWHLTRHLGWWGLAYLETALRLADQQASAAAATIASNHD
ncbi:CRISPR-associated helicase Cas3, subtype Dpsyc [Opitutaceae bacterium TAV1]|nr:CRISPR-associated protein Cas3 [Opitutaceae bacterium TAV5]EIP96632.1 CRISPR-associated helicase Cas3, subtype Dpsyc [Opitutaceae bacterium TAV1]